MSDENISMIMRQTNYDIETATQKWNKYNDVRKIIREYNSGNSELVPAEINSGQINQEIYRQLRKKMPIHKITIDDVLKDDINMS